jgi:predicted DNA-binding protein YlxM (UPF0122 family)
MNTKKQIIILYYEDKLKMVDIATELNVSKQYISKIIGQDTRYCVEKQNRKEMNKQKQKERLKEYMKKKRDNDKRTSAFLNIQHNQAMVELSPKKVKGNKTIRQWYAGAYNYNNNKKQFEFDKKIGRSYAVPNFIKY